jgi:exosortase
MLVLGRAGNMITLQELSLVAMIAGLVLCLLGKDYLKAMGFPIAYLLFMVPIADELIAPLHWSFQLLTAKMGVAFLQAMGFSVFLENQYIMLPSITLEYLRPAAASAI